jgi:hypothetical protein
MGHCYFDLGKQKVEKNIFEGVFEWGKVRRLERFFCQNCVKFYRNRGAGNPQNLWKMDKTLF